jgi:hypothetical protein
MSDDSNKPSSDDSSLSSAKTDIKVVKSITDSRRQSETNNIEPRDKKTRRKSWFGGDIFVSRRSIPAHSKSDGENETPPESDTLKYRNSKLKSSKKVLQEKTSDINESLRKDSSVFTEYYKGRKYKQINNWNMHLEIKCREIGTECATYKWLHNRNALILGGKLTTTTLAIAIISAISSISVLVDYVATNYYQDILWINPVMKLITFLLTLAVTIISIIQKTYDFVQKIQFHRTAEQRHTWLFYDIQSQLQKNTKDRMSGNDYFTWVTHELNSITDSNDIDDEVIKEFYKTFRDTKIPGLDTMNQLQVNMGDDEESSSKTSKGKSQVPSNVANGTGGISDRSVDKSVLSLSSSAINVNNNNPVQTQSEPSHVVLDIRGSQDELKSNIVKKVTTPGRLTPIDVLMQGESTKKNDNDYVRRFREQRDMNLLNLGINTRQLSNSKTANRELMEYEMRRMKSLED